jgi:glucose/mannose-6-phosphate isomerase
MLSAGGIEFSVFKGDLPRVKMDNTLVIACSASGNTEETIRMAEMAKKRTSKIAVISSGGKLEKFAERNRFPYVKIPLMIAPRYTLSYVLFSSLAVLREASVITRAGNEVAETISSMKRMARRISSSVPTARNPSKQLARLLANSTPKIYGSSITKGVATRFKNSLNENAKMHASVAYAPDLFHNEIESWETEPSGRFLSVVLRHGRESLYEKTRMERLLKILKSKGVIAEQVGGSGKSSLSQLVSMAYLLDFAAYYAAIVRGIDPFEIQMIDRLKGIQPR